MKIKHITLTVLFLLQFSVQAQDSAEENQQNKDENKRPSWSNGLPERKKTSVTSNPGISQDIDQSIEIDLGDFGVISEDETNVELAPVAEVVDTELVDTQAAAEAALSEQEQNIEAEIADQQLESQNETLESVVEEIVAEDVSNDESEVVVSNAVDPANGNLDDTTDGADVLAENNDLEVIEVESFPSEELVSVDPETSQPDLLLEPEVDGLSESIQSEYKWVIVSSVEPEYPREAFLDRQNGWVDIELTIDANGEVVESKVLKTSRKGKVFIQSAIAAVKQWKFKAPETISLEESLSKTYRLDFNL